MGPWARPGPGLHRDRDLLRLDAAIKQKDEPLRFGANRLEVQCDEGEFLVLGNRMLDVEDASEVADVRMFRFGYPPTAEHPDGDRSTWGCSWYNPTANTPRAIATAVCLPGE